MYYFGVWPGRGVGHYLYGPDGRQFYPQAGHLPVRMSALDGGLMPDNPRSGMVYEVTADPWRFFSFVDQTGDSRSGSVSVFMATGDGGSGWYMEEFRKVFPSVFARLDKAGVQLKLWDWEKDQT